MGAADAWVRRRGERRAVNSPIPAELTERLQNEARLRKSPNVWPRDAATFTVQWQAHVMLDSRPFSMLWNAPLWPDVAWCAPSVERMNSLNS